MVANLQSLILRQRTFIEAANVPSATAEGAVVVIGYVYLVLSGPLKQEEVCFLLNGLGCESRRK